MARSILRVGYAPLFFFCFLAAAVTLSAGGARPAPLLGLLLAAIATSFIAEALMPYRAAFNRPRGDIARDIAHAVVNEIASTASVLALPAVAAFTSHLDLWPGAAPIVLQLGIAIGIADLGITLAHMASHSVAILWRFHAVHHSVERMYGLNGLMKHPLHQAFETVCGTTPLLLVGMPQNVAWLLAFAVAIQLLLQHSNVDMRVDSFVRVWALAPAHRFHHVNRSPEGDVNFGLFTTVWDRLLGSFCYDTDRLFVVGDLGIEGLPDYPRRYLAQIIAPFRATMRNDTT